MRIRYTDRDGVTWATVPAAAHVVRVNIDTIHKWRRRGKVRGLVLKGRLWVCLDDVQDAERDWRRRVACEKKPECP